MYYGNKIYSKTATFFIDNKIVKVCSFKNTTRNKIGVFVDNFYKRHLNIFQFFKPYYWNYTTNIICLILWQNIITSIEILYTLKCIYENNTPFWYKVYVLNLLSYPNFVSLGDQLENNCAKYCLCRRKTDNCFISLYMQIFGCDCEYVCACRWVWMRAGVCER